jgi:transposase
MASLAGKDERTIWTIYNTLTEIEATFRCLKTDWAWRPVFHQYEENIESHLFPGLLAYQVVATIKVSAKGKKHSPRLAQYCTNNEHAERGSNNTKKNQTDSFTAIFFRTLLPG